MTNIHYGWLKEVIYCTKVFKIIYMFPFKLDQFSRNFKAWKLVNNKVAQPLRNGREGNSCIKRKKKLAHLSGSRTCHETARLQCAYMLERRQPSCEHASVIMHQFRSALQFSLGTRFPKNPWFWHDKIPCWLKGKFSFSPVTTSTCKLFRP